MKSPKSKNLFELSGLGIPVPYFFVVGYNQQCPPLNPDWSYAVRSAPFISMAGILDSVLGVDGEKVPDAINRVFASWDAPLAKQYRWLKGLSDNLQMEVVVQRIVSPKNGFAGIIHTSNPVTGKRGFSGSFVRDKYADNLCKGTETGEDVMVLHRQHLHEINEIANTIETHYGFPQDVEFVIDSSGRFWVVQVRAAQLTDYGFYNWCTQVDGGKEIAKKYSHIFDIEKCVELENVAETPLATCIGVSGDVVDGEIGRNVILLDVSDISQFPRIHEVENIILLGGNIHNHFAVEARKAKKNCVIWPRAPRSGNVWVHVQSGMAFSEKPQSQFVNKLKIKLYE